jgi:hypothetical protein
MKALRLQMFAWPSSVEALRFGCGEGKCASLSPASRI